MAARISPVAFCRSSASASSRFSRDVSFLAPASADRFRGAEALRFLVAWRAVFGRLAIPAFRPHKIQRKAEPIQLPRRRIVGQKGAAGVQSCRSLMSVNCMAFSPDKLTGSAANLGFNVSANQAQWPEKPRTNGANVRMYPMFNRPLPRLAGLIVGLLVMTT